MIVLGFMAQGKGGITAADDSGLWSADCHGSLHLVLQERTTQIDGKTVRTFDVLRAVSKSPGQTHAFNGNSELVTKVGFTDGFQAIVHMVLPY